MASTTTSLQGGPDELPHQRPQELQLALAGLALAGAGWVLRLPPTEAHGAGGRGWRDGLAGARRLWHARPLRMVTAGTTLAFVGAGALPLLVIARADELGSAAAGAGVLAAMAAGALAGALLTAAAGDRGAAAPGRPASRGGR